MVSISELIYTPKTLVLDSMFAFAFRPSFLWTHLVPPITNGIKLRQIDLEVGGNRKNRTLIFNFLQKDLLSHAMVLGEFRNTSSNARVNHAASPAIVHVAACQITAG